MKLQEVFTTNLKKIRKNAGLSQMQLAARCDSTQNYIWEIESGKKFPSVEMIEKLAAALRIEACEFFVKNMADAPRENQITQTQTPSADFDIYDLELYLSELTPALKNEFKARLLALVSRSLEKMLR